MTTTADQGWAAALTAGTERVIPVGVAPVRASPGHRAERVTDWLLGEIVRVLEIEDGWVRARGPDGYQGWTPATPLDAATVDPARWRDTATLRSLGTAAGGLRRIPWGARVRPLGDGRVGLPDGAAVEPADPDRLLDLAGLSARCPRTGAAVARSALDWLGVPYVWGGRTELGVDCSGLVQAVYAVHGVPLPRDSHAQRDADPGREVPATDPHDPGTPPPEPGDLLFFAPEGRGITHVALSLGGWRVLHAASSNGRVAVDDLTAERPLARRLGGSIVACTRPL